MIDFLNRGLNEHRLIHKQISTLKKTVLFKKKLSVQRAKTFKC